MANAAVAATSVLRSARTGAARFVAGAKPKAAPSPFRFPTQKPPSNRMFRSPVEMSFAVESMLPFHTATASALLTSMLAVARRTYGWTLQGRYSTYRKDPSKFAAVIAPTAAADSGAAPAAAVKEKKKEEPADESDDDLGFSLFD